MNIVDLCGIMNEKGASDLLLSVGKTPSLRIAGRIEDVGDKPIQNADFEAFFNACLPSLFAARIQQERDMDMGISLGPGNRYRLNVFYQKGQLSMVVRKVPSGAMDMDDLMLPPILRTFAEAPRGLVLITGATGCGKSTTMAAMVHHLNSNFKKHIVTVEDPIEFVHQDIRSIVSQREVGSDTLDFGAALKHIVRQNPDVICVGEIRDLESIRSAISAALTGHLVVTTLHSVDAVQTIERILSYFPVEQQDQVALEISISLVGIISQRLVQGKSSRGLIPVTEIVTATPRIKKLIAARNLEEIVEAIKAGANDGMQTFTQSLSERCRQGLVSVEAAAAAATNKDEFLLAAEGMQTGIDSLRM